MKYVILFIALYLLCDQSNAQPNWGYADSTKTQYGLLIKELFNVDIDTVSSPLWKEVYLNNAYSYLLFEKENIQNREYYSKRFDTIAFNFYLRGKKVRLDNDFEILFVQEFPKEKKIKKLQIIGSSFIIPKVNRDSSGILFFKYNNLTYKIGESTLAYLRPNDTIVFIYDSKPYYKDYQEYTNAFYAQRDKERINRASINIEAQRENVNAFSETIYERNRTYRNDYILNEKKYFKYNKKAIKK